MTSLPVNRVTSRRGRRWVAVVFGIALVAAHPADAATTVVSDSTFADADWTLTLATAGNGGTVVANQISQSGNFLRSIVNSVNNGSPGVFSAVWSSNIYTPFSYNPAVSGAISTISYSENAICLSGCFGDGQGTGVVILQSGNFYFSNVLLVTGPSGTFHPLSLTGLTAASFVLVSPSQAGCCDLSQHPDFSATGAPIQVGFYRDNGTTVGGGGYVLTAGIDDWQVTINSAAVASTRPIPTLGGWALLALAGMLIVVAGIQRQRTR